MRAYPGARIGLPVGFLSLLLVGCPFADKRHAPPLNPVQLKIQNDLLDRIRQLNTNVKQLETDVSDLRKQLMLVESAQYCPNPTVRGFIRSCEETSVECSVKALEDSLKIMTDFRPVMLRYRIGQKASSLNSAQLDAVKVLLAEHQRKFSTKLLVVTMPPSEKPTSLTSEADRIGKALATYLVEEFYVKLHPGELPLARLGPYTIGCTQKAALMQKYRHASKDYRGLDGEPKDSETVITAWVFLVDC